MKDFDRRVVPHSGLDEVIAEDSILRQLWEIVQFEKARFVIMTMYSYFCFD